MKIMLLAIHGGTETYRVGPLYSLVAVQDEVEFLRSTRKTLRGTLAEEGALAGVSMGERDEVVRSTKVTLTDSGLTKWPTSGKVVSDLLERMGYEYNRRLGAR